MILFRVASLPLCFATLAVLGVTSWAPAQQVFRRPSIASSASEPRVSLGVDVQPKVAVGYPGLAILKFDAKSLLDEAGLKVGDVIVSLGGNRITSLSDMAGTLRNFQPGQKAEIQVFRGKQLYRTEIAVIANEATFRQSSAKPPVAEPSKQPVLASSPTSMGIQVQDATPERGVRVTKVGEKTAGAVAGLKFGDRIVSIAGRMLRSTDDLARETALRDPGDEITLGVIRNASLMEVDVTLGGPDGRSTGNSATIQRETERPSTGTSSPDGVAGTVGSVLGGLFSGSAKSGPEIDPLALPEDEPVASVQPDDQRVETMKRIAELERELKFLKSKLGQNPK